MNNPIEILREAGIECPEVEAYDDAPFGNIRAGEPGQVIDMVGRDEADAAILALAKLVVGYKQQADCEASSADIWARKAAKLKESAERYRWQLDRALADCLDRDTPLWRLDRTEYEADLDARWEARDE